MSEPRGDQADEHRTSSSAGESPDQKKDRKKGDRRQLILIVVGVVGVIIAWISFRAKANSAGANNTADTSLPTTSYSPATSSGLVAGGDPSGGYSSGDYSDGFAAYLSNMSDELSTLNTSLTGLQTTISSKIPSPITPPKSSTTAKPTVKIGAAAKGLKYVRDLASGIIYQVQTGTGGKPVFVHVTAADYAALGKPTYTTYGHKQPPAKKK